MTAHVVIAGDAVVVPAHGSRSCLEIEGTRFRPSQSLKQRKAVDSRRITLPCIRIQGPLARRNASPSSSRLTRTREEVASHRE